MEHNNQARHQCRHHAEAGAQNHQNKIAFLDGDVRKRILSPAEILGQLPISPDSHILDIGAGSGYLSIPAAKLTGGPVFAMDMDARMLAVIAEKARAEGLATIELLQGDIHKIPLPDACVDVVLASLILHEARPLDTVFNGIARLLKTGGYFLCVDYEPEENHTAGPPMQLRISAAALKLELEQRGFHILQHRTPGESIYLITAQKQV